MARSPPHGSALAVSSPSPGARMRPKPRSPAAGSDEPAAEQAAEAAFAARSRMARTRSSRIWAAARWCAPCSKRRDGGRRWTVSSPGSAQPAIRIDGRAKVTGRAAYPSDETGRQPGLGVSGDERDRARPGRGIRAGGGAGRAGRARHPHARECGRRGQNRRSRPAAARPRRRWKATASGTTARSWRSWSRTRSKPRVKRLLRCGSITRRSRLRPRSAAPA